MRVVVCCAAGMEPSATLVQQYLENKIRGCTVQTTVSGKKLLSRFCAHY
eukprot:SAG31_NODE_1248_length_9126_cov_5.023928_5_plen_49_part_00